MPITDAATMPRYHRNPVWADTAAQVYGEVSQALSGVTGDLMVAHEILDNGLRKVTYSDGTVIYVNYTGSALTDDGITVPAMGWATK